MQRAIEEAEKRVLKARGQKNSLQRIYRELNLEEKSFVSSSQHNKRLFLTKQAKLQQMRKANEQLESSNSRHTSRHNLPQIFSSIPRASISSRNNPSTTVVGHNALTPRYIRESGQTTQHIEITKSLRTPRRRQRIQIEFANEQANKKMQFRNPSMEVTPKIGGESLDFERERRSSFEGLWRSYFEEQQRKHKSLSRSKQSVAETISKHPESISSTTIENNRSDTRGKEENKKKELPIERFGRNTTTNRITPDAQSKNTQEFLHKKQVTINRLSQVSIKLTDTSVNSTKPKEENDAQHEETSKPTNPAKDSNRRDSIPVFRYIRRGSISDVKTFTSGKVLDILSTVTEGAIEKESKQYLDAEIEELKHCRYLRSVTPRADRDQEESSQVIPAKYKSSKNIIVGHTKIAPFLYPDKLNEM